MNKPKNITNNDWELLKNKYTDLDKIVEKIENNYPVQYLIGNVDFYGNEILVNQNVLIPRFETETLVEKTIKYIKELELTNEFMLEIGTGSGCIPITIKKEIPELTITSIDISKKALSVAKKNAKLNKVDITFINSDMKKYKPLTKYSIIVSNPPYVDYDMEVDPQTKYEPQNAIFANNHGLEYYEIIFNNANKWLTNKYLLAFEIGYEQGDKLTKLAKTYFKKSTIKVEKDLSGKDRYLFIYN